MSRLNSLKKEIRKFANPTKAKILQRFFKTGKGDYGQGDIFLGLMVPQSRKLAKRFKVLAITDVKKLLKSKIHEERLIALFVLIYQYQTGGEQSKKDIYNLYLKSAKYINNWDLVDLSAPKIVGDFLLNRSRKVLYKLAKSENLWKRRIAILATYTFIKQGQLKDTLAISKILLDDNYDLIHKAVGWMLRETGKKNLQEEENFLKNHYKHMPRTALRYAIERFPPKKRLAYLTRKK